MSHPIRFAGKFLLVIAAVVAALWLMGLVFRASPLGATLVLVMVAVGLYVTASWWVRWLPALLIFGMINSFFGLVTHHAPTSTRAPVSIGVASLLLTFYSVGCLISSQYGADRLSVLDRAAFVVFLFCMVWPAFSAPNDLSTLNSRMVGEMSLGMLALIASFVAHQYSKGRKSVHAKR
jgi:hypothetical protein